MQSQGNYSSQLDQTQAPLQPPYQQHAPGSFPPQTSIQSPVVLGPALNQSTAASSRASSSAPPIYGHHLGPPPTAHHVLPLQAPACALSSTTRTSQSFVNPLQRPLLTRTMPLPSTHLNAQQSSHHPSYSGNPMVHQIIAPAAGPPWSGVSRSVSSTVLPPPPPIQGLTTYWAPVNSQSTLPGSAQSVLHSVPGSSGFLVHTIPHETHVSSDAFAAYPSSASPMPLSSLPVRPLSSSGTYHNPSSLQQQCESEERGNKSHGTGATRVESPKDVLDPSQMRSDASATYENKINDDGSNRQVSSVEGSGSNADRSLAQNVAAAPPKPAEEKVIPKIEILCQFIAKNGPAFEDMARKRESSNPEFKFLFGGEPGSEAAIAHDYFQWLKKKYCSTAGLPERDILSTSQHSETCYPSQAERLTPAAVSDERADSDMEMEDDITQLNDDKDISKLSQNLSYGTDFTQVKMDPEGQSYVAKDTVDDAAPENVLSDKVPCSGSATFDDQGRGGIIGKSAVLEDGDLNSSPASGHVNFGSSSDIYAKCPLRLRSENYPSGAGMEDNDKASCPGKLDEMFMNSAAEGPKNMSENIEVDIGPEIPSKFENAAVQISESTRTDRTSINFSKLELELKETDASSSVRIMVENSDKGHEEGSVQDVPSAETSNQNSSFKSAAEYKNENPKTSKENKDHNFGVSPTAVEVDEFGRLMREGVSDSDSDDSYHASDRSRRGRNRGRGHSPDSRRRKLSGERRRGDKRSLSRSWSPRRRRSRSKSPRRRRSRSRSPRRRRSRSRSPLRHAGEFRGYNMRRDRGRKPQCFDFLRGKCYRGASCRYSHHDSEIDELRHKKREPQNTEVKKQGWQQSSSMHNGIFDKMEVQKVEERNDLDNVDNKEQGAADQLRQGIVLDEAKDLPEENLCSTKYKSEGEINESPLAGFCHQPISDTDAITTQGKALDFHYPMKSSLEPYQVNAVAAVSASPLPHPMDSASGLKPSSDGNFTSSPVTSNVGPSAWNFPEGQKFAPQEGLPSNLYNIQPHLSSAPPSYNLNPKPSCDNSRGMAAHSGGGIAAHIGYLHYQHSHMPLNTNFGPEASLKPSPSLMYSDVQRQDVLPTGIPTSQNFAGPSLNREVLSSSHMNPFHTVNTPPAELLRPSQVHSYPPLQNRGDPSKLMYAQVPQDMNQTSFAPEYGGSGVLSQYNPYASTFEQPLTSRFGADIVPQDYRNQENSQQGVQNGGAEGTGSSMKSEVGIQQIHPQPGEDQYDPLSDSIEPSDVIEKVDRAQKRRTDYDSDVILSLSGSNKPPDLEENNKKKEIEAFIQSTSQDDDGFGETADAEVGDFENLSASNPINETNDMGGEVEIDQVESPGKSKKHRESRSTKLFKIAIANFVKEVLRPSWRQGNMSKEAFKTIVKKTVDKVTGAMKSHHIPKSQTKINHYIDSSQRKLIKLVMGYVDKYVKV